MHAPPELNRVDRLRESSRGAAKHGDLAAAEEFLLEALKIEGCSPAVYFDLSEIAMIRKRYAVAVTLMRRAMAESETENPIALARLGNALWRCQRYDESREVLKRAARMAPGHELIEQNLGLIDYFTGRAESALHHLDRALARAPDDAWVRNDHAHAVLKTGDLARGLELFESRWAVLDKSPAWDCGLPIWRGEDLSGKTLLLHAEQGFGDTLQFVRFVPAIKARGTGARVVLAVPRTLIRFLTPQCGVDEVVDFERAGDLVRASRVADYHCPMISAVAQLRPTYADVSPAPYLTAPVGSPRELRPGDARLAVGVVWAASVGHERSRQRSVPVTELMTLAEIPGVKLWSLQMAPHAREAVETGCDAIMDDATLPTMDFGDAAMIVQDMDAVVTVDTAMVHLAGGLGRPTFMLNPVNDCWRWARGTRVWYETVEKFDQSRDLTWTRAIAGVKKRLAEMLEEK